MCKFNKERVLFKLVIKSFISIGNDHFITFLEKLRLQIKTYNYNIIYLRKCNFSRLHLRKQKSNFKLAFKIKANINYQIS